MAEIQDLVTIRNEILNTPCGDVLLKFLHDFITDCATRNCDSAEIKGMCRIVQELKDVPKKLEK